MNYKISFITICHNRLPHLKMTLRQNIIDNLDYTNVEFVVVLSKNAIVPCNTLYYNFNCIQFHDSESYKRNKPISLSDFFYHVHNDNDISVQQK